MNEPLFMNTNVELLLISIVVLVAIVTFMISLRIRHKQQKQQELWRELQKQAEADSEPEDEIIAIRKSSPKIANISSSFSFNERFNSYKESQPANTTAGFKSFSNAVNHKARVEKSVLEQERSTTNHYSDLVTLYIIAQPQEKFQGYDLLQVLLSAGFRYGEMSIFHRHQKSNGEGKILFSLASATEPGIFDMDNMGAFSCKGLSLFMQLTSEEHDLNALELLLQTAEQLAEDLNGSILGADRKPLTKTMIETYYYWVRQHIANLAESG